MQVHNLVQASADVIRVTNLRPGDVYKRLPNEERYGIPKDQMLFGVVQDVLNNGTETAITALEFTADYSGTQIKVKTFRGGDDLALFPATPAEVATQLDELTKYADQAVEAARRDLASKVGVAERVSSVFASANQLTAPTTVAVEG